jgi:DNA-binding protein, YbaB/EbfC family
MEKPKSSTKHRTQGEQTMAGVGKLLKQAQKMQKQMEAVQAELAEQVLEVSSGGGAIQIKINGQGEFQAFKIDSEFLKEDAEFVEETLLAAVQEAAAKAKETSEEAMNAVTGGMGGPGGMGGLGGLM